MKAIMTISILLFCLMIFQPVLGADVYIITNSSNNEDTISKQDLRQIFMGDKGLWKDGSRIKIADNLDKKSSSEFYSKYLGKDSARIKKLWIKKMLRGKMSPPESFKSNDELLDFVSHKKHCIGFISALKAPKGVKVLKVVE